MSLSRTTYKRRFGLIVKRHWAKAFSRAMRSINLDVARQRLITRSVMATLADEAIVRVASIKTMRKNLLSHVKKPAIQQSLPEAVKKSWWIVGDSSGFTQFHTCRFRPFKLFSKFRR